MNGFIIQIIVIDARLESWRYVLEPYNVECFEMLPGFLCASRSWYNHMNTWIQSSWYYEKILWSWYNPPGWFNLIIKLDSTLNAYTMRVIQVRWTRRIACVSKPGSRISRSSLVRVNSICLSACHTSIDKEISRPNSRNRFEVLERTLKGQTCTHLPLHVASSLLVRL